MIYLGKKMITLTLICFLAVLAQFAFAADINRGTSGASVQRIQELLINQGYLVDKADGIFGNNTEYAVRAFQSEMKIRPTGEVDNITLAAMEKNNERFTVKTVTKEAAEVKPSGIYAKFGDRNDFVRAMQDKLAINGYSTGGVDGVFGNGTLNALKKFQAEHNLAQTGLIDNSTKQALERAPGRPATHKKLLMMEASAYSAQDPGNGAYTASGSLLRSGLIAVDPNVIPLGTRVYIEGYGYAIADDIGGGIVGNRIDVAMDTHAEALQFGRRTVTLYIL